jgi:hypothetical protein
MNYYLFSRKKIILIFIEIIIIISMIYYDIVILVVKLFRVEAYKNYDDFQHMNFIFSQKFISLFGGLFNDET